MTESPPDRIVTERLILRLPAEPDGADINAATVETFDDLHATMDWATSVPTLEQTVGLIHRVRASFQAGDHFSYYAFLKDDGAFVGAPSIYAIDENVPRYGIGYWCRRGQQGNGYMSEAVRALTHLAIETLGANRVEITCDVNNVASRRVAERSGYRLEATLENERLTPDGRLRTTAVYVFLPRDLRRL